MVKLSRRELVLSLLTAGVALFGISAILAKPRFDEWRALKDEKQRLLTSMTEKKRLIDQKEKWENDFSQLRDTLPSLSADRKVDVYWLSVMDNVASEHGLTIGKREAGQEQKIRNVYELPIECKDWRGDINSLVHFLFDLQKKGVILDVRNLLIRPRGKSLLRGRFLLHCVYTREEGDKENMRNSE